MIQSGTIPLIYPVVYKVGLQLTIIFDINWSVSHFPDRSVRFLVNHVSKNGEKCFQKPKVTSLNALFSPQINVGLNKSENIHIFGRFFFKNYSKRWIDYCCSLLLCTYKYDKHTLFEYFHSYHLIFFYIVSTTFQR